MIFNGKKFTIFQFPGVLSYCMSKGAVDQLTRCVALDLAPFGVRCNAVNPGVIVTSLHKTAGMDPEAYQKFVNIWSSMINHDSSLYYANKDVWLDLGF